MRTVVVIPVETHPVNYVLKSIWFVRRSADAQYVAVSSQDGYCSLLAFSKDELGTRLSTSGNLLSLLNSCLFVRASVLSLAPFVFVEP